MTSGCIVQVWFKPEADVLHPRTRFSVVETEMPDFASFCEFVDGDRLIGGAILWTRKTAPGEMTISARQPVAFRGAAVLRCELPRWRYIDETED